MIFILIIFLFADKTKIGDFEKKTLFYHIIQNSATRLYISRGHICISASVYQRATFTFFSKTCLTGFMLSLLTSLSHLVRMKSSLPWFPKLYIPSTIKNSNESFTFAGLVPIKAVVKISEIMLICPIFLRVFHIWLT